MEISTVQGCKVVTLRHRSPGHRRAFVFLPGGGYANPITASHWRPVSRLSRAAGVDAVVPLYRVSPEGTAEQALALLEEVLADLIAERGEEVLLGGDSAGAGLALATAQRHPHGVRAVVLLNPWLDAALAHPATSAVAPWDVILDLRDLRQWAAVWADGLPTTDAMVSPMNGPCMGLPPVHILTGGRDAFLPDAFELHRRLVVAGNSGTLMYSPDGNHADGLISPATPEGRNAHDAVVRWLQT
ncbi:alpha/beta hydrolase [Agromyces sp. NPDC057865]|uniref:alpha/beta hydrolase n=1 Tax=Agromyces sp. NPDC057865 TaxID=3346267 RepID=UPI00366FE59C